MKAETPGQAAVQIGALAVAAGISHMAPVISDIAETDYHAAWQKLTGIRMYGQALPAYNLKPKVECTTWDWTEAGLKYLFDDGSAWDACRAKEDFNANLSSGMGDFEFSFPESKLPEPSPVTDPSAIFFNSLLMVTSLGQTYASAAAAGANPYYEICDKIPFTGKKGEYARPDRLLTQEQIDNLPSNLRNAQNLSFVLSRETDSSSEMPSFYYYLARPADPAGNSDTVLLTYASKDPTDSTEYLAGGESGGSELFQVQTYTSTPPRRLADEVEVVAPAPQSDPQPVYIVDKPAETFTDKCKIRACVICSIVALIAITSGVVFGHAAKESARPGVVLCAVPYMPHGRYMIEKATGSDNTPLKAWFSQPQHFDGDFSFTGIVIAGVPSCPPFTTVINAWVPLPYVTKTTGFSQSDTLSMTLKTRPILHTIGKLAKNVRDPSTGQWKFDHKANIGKFRASSYTKFQYPNMGRADASGILVSTYHPWSAAHPNNGIFKARTQKGTPATEDSSWPTVDYDDSVGNESIPKPWQWTLNNTVHGVQGVTTSHLDPINTEFWGEVAAGISEPFPVNSLYRGSEKGFWADASDIKTAIQTAQDDINITGVQFEGILPVTISSLNTTDLLVVQNPFSVLDKEVSWMMVPETQKSSITIVYNSSSVAMKVADELNTRVGDSDSQFTHAGSSVTTTQEQSAALFPMPIVQPMFESEVDSENLTGNDTAYGVGYTDGQLLMSYTMQQGLNIFEFLSERTWDYDSYSLEFQIRAPPNRMSQFRETSGHQHDNCPTSGATGECSIYDSEHLCNGFASVIRGEPTPAGPLTNAIVEPYSSVERTAELLVKWMESETEKHRINPGLWDLNFPDAKVYARIYFHPNAERSRAALPDVEIEVPILTRGDLGGRSGSLEAAQDVKDYWDAGCNTYKLNDTLSFEVPLGKIWDAIKNKYTEENVPPWMTFTFTTTQNAFYYKPVNIDTWIPPGSEQQLNAHQKRYLTSFNAYAAINFKSPLAKFFDNVRQEYIFGSVGQKDYLALAFSD